MTEYSSHAFQLILDNQLNPDPLQQVIIQRLLITLHRIESDIRLYTRSEHEAVAMVTACITFLAILGVMLIITGVNYVKYQNGTLKVFMILLPCYIGFYFLIAFFSMKSRRTYNRLVSEIKQKDLLPLHLQIVTALVNHHNHYSIHSQHYDYNDYDDPSIIRVSTIQQQQPPTQL